MWLCYIFIHQSTWWYHITHNSITAKRKHTTQFMNHSVTAATVRHLGSESRLSYEEETGSTWRLVPDWLKETSEVRFEFQARGGLNSLLYSSSKETLFRRSRDSRVRPPYIRHVTSHDTSHDMRHVTTHDMGHNTHMTTETEGNRIIWVVCYMYTTYLIHVQEFKYF